MSEAIKKSEGHDAEKGYIIAICDDSSFYIPNALHIERNDGLSPWKFQDDVEAARGAEKDGVKLIYGMEHVADGVYLDSPENRVTIRKSLERFPEYLDVGTKDGPNRVPEPAADNKKFNGIALQRDSNIIDLTAILEANGQGGAARDLRELSALVSSMERQLEIATREIAAMRRELADLRDLHGEPLHNTAQQGIDAATRQILQAKERLGAVKNSIIQGAKDAVATVREKGVAALNGAVSFLGVRGELEQIQQDSVTGIARCDRSLARIENISKQFHEVGSAHRNLGRSILGRETRDDAKPMGRLAKLAAAPQHTLKKLHTGMAKGADAILGKLEKLEQPAKPSLLGELQSKKEAAKAQGMALSPDKSKSQEPSL